MSENRSKLYSVTKKLVQTFGPWQFFYIQPFHWVRVVKFTRPLEE